jgi:hypothetical protein
VTLFLHPGVSVSNIKEIYGYAGCATPPTVCVDSFRVSVRLPAPLAARKYCRCGEGGGEVETVVHYPAALGNHGQRSLTHTHNSTGCGSSKAV